MIKQKLRWARANSFIHLLACYSLQYRPLNSVVATIVPTHGYQVCYQYSDWERLKEFGQDQTNAGSRARVLTILRTSAASGLDYILLLHPLRS